MGAFWSSPRRNNYNNYHNPHARHSQLISSSSSPYPNPPSSDPYPVPPTSSYQSTVPTQIPPPLTPAPPPQQQQQQQQQQQGPPPVYMPYYYSGGLHPVCNYGNPMVGRSGYGPYYPYQNNGWAGARPPPMMVPQLTHQPPPPPPPYVDHQQAKKVKNNVNVHKDTVRLEVDEQNPDHYLISFVFDALYDGSFTIFYFAKIQQNCTFVPLFPDAFKPVKVPFLKGSGQRFRQPNETGIDLGFFALEDLSKPSPEEDVFPLVISAETYVPSFPAETNPAEPLTASSPNFNITQAIIEKKNDLPFQVRVVKQILWIDGVQYELREIYGIGNTAEGFKDDDPGKECVICMTEPKDTAVLPCRHMCMCSECSKALRLQSNKCPICRQPIEELIEIKVGQ
ncbi:probable E3 ubiquitin-protein ligase LUL3 [Impatiens glandulifera]|uniref:probable E3 ubiquitin-protein ligase LUL3 n=1 Tax=Impatiens glandulifera TaxID=253017 RepID=UPI001FB0B650|nr:probable E3 ubiquitin-protein ligase LUL3 [Impatiens glandulifera]XP_047317541.1 probable E3 ubiquitin-protein ligase LUL3 [Impatiens glandulifera]